MNFNPSNHFLNIWDSIGTPTPSIRSVWAHSLTLSCIHGSVNVIPMLHFWSTFFHAFALVIKLRLGWWWLNSYFFQYLCNYHNYSYLTLVWMHMMLVWQHHIIHIFTIPWQKCPITKEHITNYESNLTNFPQIQ
jgi:hypothetical protein